MPSPFPGMDPFLEDSDVWPGFHKLLAAEMVAQLNPQIGPKYYADVEVRTEIEEIGLSRPLTLYPDTGVLERTGTNRSPLRPSSTLVEFDAPIIRRISVGAQVHIWSVRLFVTETSELVTAIEILSPTNKRRGENLDEYRRKRSRLLRSHVNLVEIDLLRGGERPGHELHEPSLDSDYVLLVNRNSDTEYRNSEIWPVGLNEPLSVLPIPLITPDPDATLNLRAAIDRVYEHAGYAWRIDYHQPIPPPALRPAMVDWLSQHLPQIGS